MRKGIGPRGLGAAKSPLKQTSTAEKVFDIATKVVMANPAVQAGKMVYDYFAKDEASTPEPSREGIEARRRAGEMAGDRIGRARGRDGMNGSMTRNISRMDEPMTKLPRKEVSFNPTPAQPKLQPTNVTKPAAKPTKKQARKNKRADKLEAKANKLRG